MGTRGVRSLKDDRSVNRWNPERGEKESEEELARRGIIGLW